MALPLRWIDEDAKWEEARDVQADVELSIDCWVLVQNSDSKVGFIPHEKWRKRSTWQILTVGWGGWGGKLAIEILTPSCAIWSFSLLLLHANCVARGRTIKGQNWSRIAKAENQKQKKWSDIRWDVRTSIFVVPLRTPLFLYLIPSELLFNSKSVLLMQRLKRSKCESWGNGPKKNSAIK